MGNLRPVKGSPTARFSAEVALLYTGFAAAFMDCPILGLPARVNQVTGERERELGFSLRTVHSISSGFDYIHCFTLSQESV